MGKGKEYGSKTCMPGELTLKQVINTLRLEIAFLNQSNRINHNGH